MSVAADLSPLLTAIEELKAEVRQLRQQLPTQLVDIETAADYMGVSTRTVRRLVKEERIAYRRVGRRIRFDLSKLSPRCSSSMS